MGSTVPEPAGRRVSVLLMEAGLDQRGHGIQCFLGVPTLGGHLDDAAMSGAEHDETHDRAGRDSLAVARHLTDGAEMHGRGHQLGGGTGIKATGVGNAYLAAQDRLATWARLRR